MKGEIKEVNMEWQKTNQLKNGNDVSDVTSIITENFLVTSILLLIGLIWNIKVSNPGVALSQKYFILLKIIPKERY